MKKRILSMLLALAMLLSMVPVQALAEDVTLLEEPVAETVAETIAEETEEATEATEATEETEETEATEATEVTETTEAAEVTEATEATEETEAAEVTEATEAVLVDMDGLPADGDAEPVEVLIIPAEDSEDSGVIAVDEVLTLMIDDSDITVKDVKWSSTNVNVATVGESTGVVRGIKVGTVYINVACLVLDEETNLYVKGEGKYLLTVQDPEVPEYRIEIADNCPTEMMAGETITLTAKVLDEDNEEVIPQPLLKWTLVDPKDDEYVYLKPTGSLSALSTSQHKREISVRVSFADNKLNPESVDELPTTTITVYPRINKIELLVDDTDEYIKDGVYYFNLNNASLCASGITVSTVLYPEDELKPDAQLIEWKVNDSRSLCYQPSTGDNERILIKPYDMNKTGTVTVTATAKDGSGVSEKLEIRFVKLAPVVEILNAPEQMRGNSSVTLTTNVATMSGLTDRKIIWEVFDGGEGEYATDAATISSTGKLTANRVDAPVTIKVKATAEMGGVESDYAVIEIVPAVESIEIRLPYGYESGNIPYDASPADAPLQLEAVVEPEEAIQSVTWGTSNKNIVSIDEDGNLTIKNAGKVRISATAKDGSKRAAYIYLTITKPVNEVHFDAGNPTELRSGKSATMKATAWTVYDEYDETACVKAANQKLRWEVYEEEDGIREETTKATITSSGRLSVKDIKTNATIVVRAISQETAPDDVIDNVTEDGYAYADYYLTIKPAKRISLLLRKDGEEITTSTVQMNANENAEIAGFWYDSDPGDGIDNESPVTLSRTIFTSSNKTVATIDEFGVLETKKTGSTTITVQSRESNGTLHTVKFTLKVTNLVEELQIVAPKSTELRSGKTLTLKATAWTIFQELKANNQKVTWSIVGEDNGPTEAATISSSGRVSAKTVTEDTIVRVIARSVENPGAEDSIELTIRPKQAYTMSLTFTNYDGEDYPNEEKSGAVTVPCNLSGVNPDDLRDNLNVAAYVALDGVYGYDDPDAEDGVVWYTSSKSIVSIDANTGALRVLKPGKVTLTAKKTLVDEKGKKTTYSASIPLVLVNAVTSIDVDRRVPGQKLYAGKTLAMRADTNPDATNKRVKWSLVGDYDDDYAVINANSGVITAKRTVKKACQVTVKAEALDGYECESATFTVDIYPLATEVKPTLDGSPVSMTDHGFMKVKDEAVLGIEEPENGADPEIKWTSSRTSVATIKWDKTKEAYVLVAKGKGTATIKATAQDGSGKTASFIVEVSN